MSRCGAWRTSPRRCEARGSRRSRNGETAPIEGDHPYLYLDGIVMKRTWAGEVRNVSRSIPACLAIADTDRPCRCRSRIIIISLSLITEIPLPTIGSSIGDDM